MSFVSPFFALGALVAAVPILLHLIRREHARRIEFPTLMFLRRITKRTIRYQKLRHLLLLLLRVLALLLLVFAFMRPYRESARAATPIGRIARAHIIVLDTSMSMSCQDRWARAQKAAAEIVKTAGPEDRFAVLAFSDRTEVLMVPAANAAEALMQIEKGAQPGDGQTRYGQALKIAERLAVDAGTGKRIIHLISDFQKNGWAAEEQEFRLGAGIDLLHVDVGSSEFSNLAIRDVHVIEADKSSDGGVVIKASAINFGNRDRGNVSVKLWADGRMIAEKRVSVAKGSSAGVEFQLPGLLSGLHSAMLEIDDPSLTRDNRYCMTIEGRGKTPVLVVDNPEVRGRRLPSYYLAKALNVGQLSPYQLTAATPQNFALSGRLLVWNDAPAGSAAIQKKLQEFVEAGGGLAIVLGDATRSADFNRTFGSWLPVKMTEASAAGDRAKNRPAEDYVVMTDVRADHPIFQPFGKPHSGTFSSARFFRHARITAGAGAEIPARFDNGDPALAAINAGKGRVLIFTSSADDSSNDLPLKAVYAPFWQQLLRYLESFREQRHWLEVGDMMAPKKYLVETALLPAKGAADATDAIAILDPKKKRLALPPNSEGIIMEQAGFYEIRTMNVSAPVAVNTIPRESDLTQGNAEEMIAGWLSVRPEVIDQKERPAPEERDKRQRMWVLLLFAAALFLAAESLLSNARRTVENRDGRPAAGPMPAMTAPAEHNRSSQL
jgi:hypothetical protein